MGVVAVVLAALLLTGAAPAHAVELPEPGHARAGGLSDLSVEWQGRRQDDRLVVTGLVRNLWPYRLRNLELRMRLVGLQGEELGRAIFLFVPVDLPAKAELPFGLAITVPPGKKPARLEFLFDYLLQDGGEGGIPIFYGFDAELPGLQ